MILTSKFAAYCKFTRGERRPEPDVSLLSSPVRSSRELRVVLHPTDSLTYKHEMNGKNNESRYNLLLKVEAVPSMSKGSCNFIQLFCLNIALVTNLLEYSQAVSSSHK